MNVESIDSKKANAMVVEHHYLHRKTSIVHAFGLYRDGDIRGVITFGIPAARHLQMGACPSNPDLVMELNRLWVHDDMPRNSETWFIARALSLLPPRIIVSYADTTKGHMGFVYRAANFDYAGWTDMERKTARYDYLSPGKHTRDAFRGGLGAKSEKRRRQPKVKYWTVTGDARDKKQLRKICGWPSLSWKTLPPPMEHRQHKFD
jgi:hypothetical protein